MEKAARKLQVKDEKEMIWNLQLLKKMLIHF